jgi:hypothetical protein
MRWLPFVSITNGNEFTLTGVFTLDVYCGQPEWKRNLEAGCLAGSEIERAVDEANEKLQKRSECGVCWQLNCY